MRARSSWWGLAGALALAWSSAFAQQPPPDTATAEALLLTTTTGGPTTGGLTTIGGVVVLIVVLVSNANQEVSTEPIKATELYLRQNAMQLATDLTHGSGPALDELALAMHLRGDDAAAFRRVLHQHRTELVSVCVDESMNQDIALRCVRRIASVVSEVPALRAHLEARATKTYVRN